MPWDHTTHPKVAMPMTAASVAQRRKGLKASIWDNEGVLYPPWFPTNSAGGYGRPSTPGKCQQENAYGQCLPKASKPELSTRRLRNPAPSNCNDMLCSVMERGFRNHTGKTSDAHQGRAQGGDQAPLAAIARVSAAKS